MWDDWLAQLQVVIDHWNIIMWFLRSQDTGENPFPWHLQAAPPGAPGDTGQPAFPPLPKCFQIPPMPAREQDPSPPGSLPGMVFKAQVMTADGSVVPGKFYKISIETFGG